MVVATPADAVAQQGAEGIEVPSGERGAHPLGQVVSVVRGAIHAPIIPARAAPVGPAAALAGALDVVVVRQGVRRRNVGWTRGEVGV